MQGAAYVTGSRWELTVTEAVAEQRRLADRVQTRGKTERLRWIAGLDASFSPDGHHCLGAVVLWDRRNRKVVEQQVARSPLRFPYIPGLLSFREAPALLRALGLLNHTADALICDGQGIAHPRRFGLACHVGILTGLPAVGCAKSRLIGTHAEVGQGKGSWVPLLEAGSVIGAVLRTRRDVRPVYVSVGHRVGLEDALDLVLDCTDRYRLPEPTRLADRLTKSARAMPLVS